MAVDTDVEKQAHSFDPGEIAETNIYNTLADAQGQDPIEENSATPESRPDPTTDTAPSEGSREPQAPGGDPQTMDREPAAPSVPPPSAPAYAAPRISPAVIARARQSGLSDPEIGQLGNDAAINGYLMGMARSGRVPAAGTSVPPGRTAPLAEPGTAPQGKPTGYEPFELEGLPDDADDGIASFGKNVGSGFGHVNQHVSALYERVATMEAGYQAMADNATAYENAQKESWFDQRIQALTNGDEAWSGTFGKGTMTEVNDPSARQSRQNFYATWDKQLAIGYDAETAFNFVLNGAFAAQTTINAHAQRDTASQRLVKGAAVPPAGQPAGAAPGSRKSPVDEVLDGLAQKGKVIG